MPRSRIKLEPWIETLIVNYDTELEISTRGLKAHVVGVGQMSDSQARGAEGPTGLLFLSDGVVQIPALLTESAWENLQEQEDRECFSSLVNTIVFLKSYRLQFSMGLELQKCRFFLSVGELASAAVVVVKDQTPCCTSLPSVKLKISQTWGNLLYQDSEDAQDSQSGTDLSLLLGEWYHDCMETVAEDARERLAILRRSVSLQPFASPCFPSVFQSDIYTGTEWDTERIKHKGAEPFSIPFTHLLIPEETQQPHVQSDEGSEIQNRLLVPSEDRERNSLPALQDVHAVQPTVDYFKLHTDVLAVMDRGPEVSEHSLSEENMLNEDTDMRIMDDANVNPWDTFPPPSDVLSTSSSNKTMTSDYISIQSQVVPSTIELQNESVAVITSTQIPCHGQGVAEASGQSGVEHCFLPPYQEPQPTSSLVANSSPSTSTGSHESISRPLNLSRSVETRCSQIMQHPMPVSNQENVQAESDIEMREVIQKKCKMDGCKMAKRNRIEDMPDALTVFQVEGEAQIDWSPPSWLYETQFVSRAEVRNSLRQAKATGAVPRKVSTFHSDGTRFSYSYTVSDQSLQSFSKFKVVDNVVHWAVKYLLVPKQTTN